MKRPAVYLIEPVPAIRASLQLTGSTASAPLTSSCTITWCRSGSCDRPARNDAELIDVGTATPQPMAQEAISYLLAEKAREGKRVARLKWGDPFLFARGAEEALFLHEQGIPFECYWRTGRSQHNRVRGVPVSYPGAGDTVTLLRGHEDDNRSVPDVDWASLIRLDGTVVCYASAQQLTHILESLRANGWGADTRGGLIYNGTLPDQETISGTITEFAGSAR